MIDFNFTLEEYEVFLKIKDDIGKCAFTNLTFVNSSKNFPTAERIDNSKPYSKENCVWVTYHANTLKNKYIENNGDRSKLVKYDNDLVTRIKRVLETGKIDTIMTRYLSYYNERCATHVDIDVAKRYIEFKESCKDGIFQLPFYDFKRFISRKKCSVSNLDIDITTLHIFVINKNKPIDAKNILVIHRFLSKTVEFLLGNCEENTQMAAMTLKRLHKVVLDYNK